MSKAGRAKAGRAVTFLERLADPGRPSIDCGKVVGVFAHPDDETIAMGGQLDRLRGIRIVHVTDGAPAGMQDADELGFARRDDYAAARRRELEAALAHAAVGAEALHSLGAIDQKAAYELGLLARRLAAHLRMWEVEIVITHAYEGGHPDHDATAYLVELARRIIARNGGRAPSIVECPLYHSDGGEWVRGVFAGRSPSTGPEVSLALDDRSTRRKQHMLAEFLTQARTLSAFPLGPERFRLAPAYDFSALPNGGELLYENFDWGIDRSTWLQLAAEAERELEPWR